MIRFVLRLLVLPTIFLISSCGEKEGASGGLEAKDQISYNFHVRPILSDNCFACHGPDANTREAGLRLDVEEAAYAALKENPDAHAIIPGDPDNSEAFRRIISDDPHEKMPPPESHLTLSEEEVSIIRKWVSQGAVYED